MKNKLFLLVFVLCGFANAVDLGGGSSPSSQQKQKLSQPRILLDFSEAYKRKHNGFRGWFISMMAGYTCVNVAYDQYTASRNPTLNPIRELLLQGAHHGVSSTLIALGYSHVFADKIYGALVIGITQSIASTKDLKLHEYGNDVVDDRAFTDTVFARAVYGGTGISCTARIGLVILPRLILYGLIGVQLDKHKIEKDKKRIVTTISNASAGGNQQITTSTINPTNNDPRWFYPSLRAGVGAEMRIHTVLSFLVEAIFIYANSDASVNKILSQSAQGAVETSIIHKNVGFALNIGIVYNI